MLSRRILTIGIAITVLAAYFFSFENVTWCIWLIAAGVLISINAFIFQHQLNWWWYTRKPPSLDPPMDKMYLTAGNFYKALGNDARKEFGVRARLFIEEKEFIGQGVKTIPEDVKYMIAYYAVMVTFHTEEFLFKHHRRIVIYLHPFLTPLMPDHVHTYELEHTDGTMIFALEQLTAGFFNSTKYYQTGLHVFAELYYLQYLQDAAIGDEETIWKALEEISGWSRKKIEDFTGVGQASPVPVMLHHWFAFPEKMKAIHPEMFAFISGWLQKN